MVLIPSNSVPYLSVYICPQIPLVRLSCRPQQPKNSVGLRYMTLPPAVTPCL